MTQRDNKGKFVKQGGPIKINVASKKEKIFPQKGNDAEIKFTAVSQTLAIKNANEAAFLLHMAKSAEGTKMKVTVDVKKNFGFSHSEFGFRPTEAFMTEIMEVIYKHYRKEGEYKAKIEEANELIGKEQDDVINRGLNKITKIEEEVKFL